MATAPRFRPVISVTIAVALIVTALIGYSGCSSGGPAKNGTAKKEPFDIGMVTFAGYAPLYLAKEKGFFGDLQVNLHRIDEVASIRAGIANGELEAYLATPDIALDTNQKPPGIGVWAIDESSGGDGVVVAEGIEKLADLKGRKVAAEPGLPPRFVLMYLLHKHGMSLSDIEFKDMTTQDASTAFVSKSVDAAGIYEPFLSTAAKQREGSKVAISSADVPGLIVDLIFVDERTLKSRPQDVTKVIEGWRKAVRFIKESPDVAFPIMAKAFNLPEGEFKDIAAGVKWLDLDENKILFGTAEKPGPLYPNFSEVGEVLHRNRKDMYRAKAEDHLIRQFVTEGK
jgi:NitT/TauT family transport system substrate-binding protein